VSVVTRRVRLAKPCRKARCEKIELDLVADLAFKRSNSPLRLGLLF
jgi:hypothetical protein